MVRVAGPSLNGLGFTGFLSDPVFSILNSSGRIVAGAGNDNWDSDGAANTAALSAAFAQNGAFPSLLGPETRQFSSTSLRAAIPSRRPASVAPGAWP